MAADPLPVPALLNRARIRYPDDDEAAGGWLADLITGQAAPGTSADPADADELLRLTVTLTAAAAKLGLAPAARRPVSDSLKRR